MASKSVRLKDFASMARHGMRPKLAVVQTVCRLVPGSASGWVRGRLYRWVGMDIDSTAFVIDNLSLPGGDRHFASRLHVGAGSVIATHVTINLHEHVRIGQNVTVGPHCKLYTSGHDLGPGSKRCIAEIVVAKPVVIEDGAWLAMGVIVLPGVTIGRGAVVSAGSVVTKDVPPNTYVQGVPAEVVRKLPLGNR